MFNKRVGMNILKKTFSFYIDGFKELSLGKSLWKIVIIKLVVILVILNLFIYDKTFKSEYKSYDEKKDFVFSNMMKGR